MRDPRLNKLADVIVGYSTAVRKGDLVRLSGNAITLPLLGAVHGKVIAAGGHPLVRVTGDDFGEAFMRAASDAQLQFVNPVQKYEVETIDVSIGLWGEVNTKAMTNADPKRAALASAARKPIFETFMRRAAKKELRWCGTQYPTQAHAQDAEMSLSEYADFVFAAGLLHEPDPAAAWRKVSEAQQRLVDHLQGKDKVRVVAANGTDLTFSVAGRTWVNCDGHENFPDGEVFTGPVLDSAEGVVQFSFPAVHHGREVQGARLTFKAGRVVDASATKGEDFLISMLDTDAGSRFLGESALGTNYGITRYTKNTLFDEKIGGTVHLAVGAGYPETGNDNASGLHWDMVVDLRAGGYVEVDEKKVSENGKFTDDRWPR